ncbi:MAP kinase phosphatase with leucine-rich repeats protein 2-like isoform X2 [Mizuhopecten yessoensis]|nr:MAP kinase phosphatase with leucine-rich repeats protein 2-like isoform X2 [Mizuhopecten yessoensis]XP_021369853.1 MAP kinase phosphatase with leucine-rich repeats protein 2-like isoform X2 [Mizuhopecten yessoensis]XP_021369854.1 MAP kinase phosphatase with leucine-rich repeats protein 2-like isoform X2 [Mizuhopecten yessoensis]
MSTETHRYNDHVVRPIKALLPATPSTNLVAAGTSSSPSSSLISRKLQPKIQKSASLKDLFFKKNSTEAKPATSPAQPRTKIADLVQRHLIPLNIISSFKANRRNLNGSTSCQKLVAKEGSESITEKENFTEVQYLSIPDNTTDTSIPQTNIFNKTDILFTTSFTHSVDKSIDCQSCGTEANKAAKPRLTRSKSRSAQSLHRIPQLGAVKQTLTRSYSDVPPNSKLALVHSSSSSLSEHLQSRMYRNDFVSQLLDHLFIGSVEAAYNEPLLCRLKIDCVLDISNCAAADVPSSKKLHCPCICPKENQHFRSRLIIQVEDRDTEDIEAYFPEINKFIVAARHRGKRVLVFSYHGKSRAAAAAIQYMMSQENLLLRQAFNLVKNQRPCVDIIPAFMAKLEALERKLFPDAKPSISFGNEYLNIADPQAIRCAWVDCADI